MRYTRIIIGAVTAFMMLSCQGNSAKIRLDLQNAPSGKIVIKAQDISKYTVLDTLEMDKEGRADYKVPVPKGDPEFFYLYKDNSRIASLLLEAGDKVKISADEAGNYAVEGSEVSAKMMDILAEQQKTDAELGEIVASFSGEGLAEARRAFNEKFISNYRKSLRLAMDNCKSLLVIPILYQNVQGEIPVFGNVNDALIFRSICDSLKTVYPDSRYVKALETEVGNRMSQMELSHRIGDAEVVSFPELDLPDKNLKKIKLSGVDAKFIILHFWDPSDPEQKMLNKDVLLPLYREFHEKGLEIYQVAVTNDRTGWGLAIDDQKLPWINVCDMNAGGKSSVAQYNLQQLPTTFFISDGELQEKVPATLPEIRKLIRSMLK